MLWVISIVLLAIPALGFRVGELARSVPFDEAHLVERLGLLTIIVMGESFVKVSLVVSDGHLDGIDVLVLVALFVAVFAIWWSYFDDVPDAGIRDGVAASIGWLLGHLFFQLFLIGVAIAYAKWLQLEIQNEFTASARSSVPRPTWARLLALALIGVCTRRVPQRALRRLAMRDGGGGARARHPELASCSISTSRPARSRCRPSRSSTRRSRRDSQRSTRISEARTAVP